MNKEDFDRSVRLIREKTNGEHLPSSEFTGVVIPELLSVIEYAVDVVSPPKENRLTMKAVKEAIDPANGPDMFELYMLQAKAMMEEAKKVRAVKCPKCVHYKMKYGSSGGETYKVCHRCARDTWGKVDAHPDMFKEAESGE
jgi:hypothetical protein